TERHGYDTSRVAVSVTDGCPYHVPTTRRWGAAAERELVCGEVPVRQKVSRTLLTGLVQERLFLRRQCELRSRDAVGVDSDCADEVVSFDITRVMGLGHRFEQGAEQ